MKHKLRKRGAFRTAECAPKTTEKKKQEIFVDCTAKRGKMAFVYLKSGQRKLLNFNYAELQRFQIGKSISVPLMEFPLKGKDIYMIFRQKLTYTALGGLLMLVGMLFSSISPLTAQKDVFGDITCTSLTVVDKDGKSRVVLFGDPLNIGEGNIVVYRKTGHPPLFSVGPFHDGGVVSLFGSGGGVFLRSFDKPNVHVSGGGSSQSGATMSVGEEGEGEILVYRKKWDPGIILSGNENGGFVNVFGKDGKGAVQLRVTEHGGRVSAYGKVDDKSRAIFGVNEYGHGVVSTWDKHGSVR